MVDNIKPSNVAEAIRGGDDWGKWANYVLISLEKLNASVTDLRSEYYKIRESLLKELSKIREELRREIEKRINEYGVGDVKRLKEFEERFNSAIDKLSDRVVGLEQSDITKDIDEKIKDIREKEITPLRNKQISVFSKLGLIAAVASIVGGGTVVFLLNLFRNFLSGG